jgi:predicted  nucleic acid-binding Zn-ribbon protein
MNKQLELILRLEELVLQRQARQRMGEHGPEQRELDERIGQARRRVPGAILSKFDQLAREYANTVVPVVEHTCQGCQQPLSPRLSRSLGQASQLLECEHCGRFLIMPEQVPDYLP